MDRGVTTMLWALLALVWVYIAARLCSRAWFRTRREDQEKGS